MSDQVLSLKESSQETSPIADFVQLLKPSVMSLIVFTGFTGMIVAPTHLHPFLCFVVLLAIALGSGAAGAINMWYDADIDQIMERTRNRPIPAGRLEKDTALQFGVILAGFSIALLYLATNLLAAGVLAVSIGFYVFIYTMFLKRATPQNIVIGGAAGAFPPVIGWVAMTGELSVEPLLLFAVIFFWTPPHFWALSLYRSSDYAKAGVPMLPVIAGIQSTKKHILVYSLILGFVGGVPLLYGMTGLLYGILWGVLNLVFIRFAWLTYVSNDMKPARRLFGYSILYLFLLFSGFIMDKVIS